jgi:hypothetical protein
MSVLKVERLWTQTEAAEFISQSTRRTPMEIARLMAASFETLTKAEKTCVRNQRSKMARGKQTSVKKLSATAFSDQATSTQLQPGELNSPQVKTENPDEVIIYQEPFSSSRVRHTAGGTLK